MVSPRELTQPRKGGGGGLAAVSCHVPNGSCTMWHSCHPCWLCRHDTKGGGRIGKCAVTRDMDKLRGYLCTVVHGMVAGASFLGALCHR